MAEEHQPIGWQYIWAVAIVGTALGVALVYVLQ